VFSLRAAVIAQTQRFADEVREAADFVRGVLGEAEVALVLGSGLNGFIDVLEDRKELPYAEIPHMPTTTVKGHFGRLASGKVGGLKVRSRHPLLHHRLPVVVNAVVDVVDDVVMMSMMMMMMIVMVLMMVQIFCLAGRSHAYEGKNMYQLTFTARLMRALGCQILIATNASGGCGEGMVPGCLMVITDHINLFHRNPVAGTSAASFGVF
jgi:purine-nucleoside phosphorylase